MISAPQMLTVLVLLAVRKLPGGRKLKLTPGGIRLAHSAHPAAAMSLG